MSITSDQQTEIVSILYQLLSESENPCIRARAAKSLGRLGIPDAILTLCQAVSTDSDVQVRLNAMDALVSIAKPNLTTMAKPPKNQPTFNIGSVGNINTGDITIQGDQVGIQFLGDGRRPVFDHRNIPRHYSETELAEDLDYAHRQ